MASILDLISAVLIDPPLLRGGRTVIGEIRRVEAVLTVSCFRQRSRTGRTVTPWCVCSLVTGDVIGFTSLVEKLYPIENVSANQPVRQQVRRGCPTRR